MKANIQNHFFIPAIGLLLGTCSIVSAADILFISSSGTSSDSLQNFLVADGNNVTRELRPDGPGNANDFDLIIIGRDTSSNSYTSNPAEITAWNAVTAPILCLSNWFYGSNSWGWITTASIGLGGTSLAFNVPYPDPAHPFLSGLADPTQNVFATTVNMLRFANSDLIATGTTTVANGSGSTTTSGLFTIAKGTILTNAEHTAAGNIRIAWPMQQIYEWNNIGSNGEQIMRNIIATVAPTEALLITSVSFDSESGDFLVNFSPGGADYVLTSSNDLASPFVVESSAILENDDTTFRVPAANLNPNQDFFRVEEAP